jgi:hypothetical protein
LRCYCNGVFDVAESYIYEDPAVAYEGFVADPDPIDLENYLVSLLLMIIYADESQVIYFASTTL